MTKKNVDVNSVLRDYTCLKSESDTEFSTYHKNIIKLIYQDEQNTDKREESIERCLKDMKECLEKFFDSTVDEVRLFYANKFADLIIERKEKQKNYFRAAVQKKEATSEIEYRKQRDHAAHTLNNFILGWYLFSKVEKVKDEISKKIKIRLTKPDTEITHQDIVKYFGKIWPYASLLHDVGYILEGAINVLSTKIHSKSVRQGADIIEDYFNHRFWFEVGLDSVSTRKKLLNMIEIDEPDFSNKSLAAVADSLFRVGEIQKIGKVVQDKCANAKSKLMNPKILYDEDFPNDSFDIWKKHYRLYGADNMAERMQEVKMVFHTLVWDGLPSINLKMIDHGIASGLLLMLQTSYFLRLYYGLKSTKTDDPPFKENIEKKLYANGFKEDALVWWSGIVWATAATAIHNIQQMKWPWPGCEANKYKGDDYLLKLEDDPIAYLGILVDLLQEWDRYSVNPESIFSGELPLQGKDVVIKEIGDKIIIDYHNDEKAKKVTKSLNESLYGWKKLVEIKIENNISESRKQKMK